MSHGRLASMCSVALALAAVACSRAAPAADADSAALPVTLPLVAVWRADDGYTTARLAPYLRVAVWPDGRTVFADDPSHWGHTLREGRIEVAQLVTLKAQLAGTGVFGLEGNCYLVPDAPTDCIFVSLEGREQMLYWDEVEQPNYGININPEQRHLDFMAAWKAVNRAALAARPSQSTPFPRKFEVPESWHVSRPIQSR